MLSKGDLLTALRDCYDPDVKLNLIDMGCVFGVATGQEASHKHVGPGQWVKVRMTLPNPIGPSNIAIVEQVHDRLTHLDSVSRVEVELVWEPRWSEERISESGRKQLGL